MTRFRLLSALLLLLLAAFVAPSAWSQTSPGAQSLPPAATRPATTQVVSFVPTDVDRTRPLYQTRFDDPAEINDWALEGGKRAAIENGRLVLESEGENNHLVCWLKKEMPADFCLEVTVLPVDRRKGLNIVFFNARGVGGQSIFDPSLERRDGTYKQYHSGDINAYHASYWAAGRELANLRKSKGFHLVAQGPDLVYPATAPSFQTVRVHKRGAHVRLSVDDQLVLDYIDDGQTGGPPLTHSGWIGLRQMGRTVHCEYDSFAVYPLK